MIPENTVIRVGEELLSTMFGAETVILSLKNQVYYGLDEVGSRIWELIQQPVALRAVRDVLLEEFDVDPAACERDLIELLEDLRSKGLARLEIPRE